MFRPARIVLRVALLTVVLVPCFAWADALPPDPEDIYYHCTPSEQCAQGSETCTSVRGPAGRTWPDEACAKAAEGKGLEQRCAGKGGYLYCPKGATGSWKPSRPSSAPSASPPPATPAGSAPRRGCS